MKGTEYGNIRVPKGLLAEVDRVIRTYETLGYTSRNQFCITAVRELCSKSCL